MNIYHKNAKNIKKRIKERSNRDPRIFKIGLINRLTTVLLIALHNIWYSNQLFNIRLF